MTRVEALGILGNPEPFLEDVKRAFREAALKYHPDKGGDVRQMQLVNDAWQFLRKIVQERGPKAWSTWHQDMARESPPLTERMDKAYQAIKHIPDIKIELCGCWLWVGNTDPEMAPVMSAAGFFWAPKKQKWFWKPNKLKHRKRSKEYSMDDIRTVFGSEDLENNPHKQV